MEKKFQVSFEVTINTDAIPKEFLKFIVSKKRLKLDIESVLEEEFTFSVSNLKVEEKVQIDRVKSYERCLQNKISRRTIYGRQS